MAHKSVQINGVSFSLLTGKQAQALIDDYESAWHRGDTYLWEVYGRCSWEKERAYESCKRIRDSLGGTTMFIHSYNTFMFTLVYTFTYEGVEYVVKETPTNRFICKYE